MLSAIASDFSNVLLAERERLAKQQAESERDKLAAYLRSLGINPDDI